MIIIFWIGLFIVFYTFLGYGILLYILLKIKRLVSKSGKVSSEQKSLPSLTLVVAAYNEVDIMRSKIENCLRLQYPKHLLNFLFVTDGSTDGTPDLIAKYPEIQLMHEDRRAGKINAIHRVMKNVHSEVVVFTDANTFLNEEALLLIARHYVDPKVGAVSGEKRVDSNGADDAASNEGLYWKYESLLKKWDSELYSVVGAAGELFSVRRSLYEPVAPDTILDDFMISMQIAEKGYKIVYEPTAFAVESGSENVEEELKRKVRIAAGGIQSILRLTSLLNPLKFPILTFQYISHRVLRWTVTPVLLPILLLLNVLILIQNDELIYRLLMIGQIGFYSMAVLGWIAEQNKKRYKLLFVPFYFCMMNYAVIAGILRFAKGSQSAAWEKSKRKKITN